MITTVGYVTYIVIIVIYVLSIYQVWRFIHGSNPLLTMLSAVFGLGLVGVAVWYIGQQHLVVVPGSIVVRDAEISDRDLNPMHEDFAQVQNLEPVPLIMGRGFGVGLVASPNTVVTHVPNRYSLLLHWSDGQAWVPVDGFTYRKVKIGSRVKVRTSLQREMSFVSEGQPRPMAALLGSSVWPEETQN